MDAGIADTINRRDARLIAEKLDRNDLSEGSNARLFFGPWYESPLAETIMGENASTGPDRAWLIGAFASRTPGVSFDGEPADCDWENLFAHFRAEILSRRDPQTPSVHAAETPVRDGVGSR